MALIACPECGQQVSTAAKSCPACGYPVADQVRHNPALAPLVATATESPDAQPVLLEVRPSWWNFFWHLLFCWLIVPLVVALYRRHGFVMRIYADRVAIEEGVFAKEHREFFIKDIRSIDVIQGLWSRLCNIGTVTISTAASVDAAEEARGVPGPMAIKELLIRQRQQAME